MVQEAMLGIISNKFTKLEEYFKGFKEEGGDDVDNSCWFFSIEDFNQVVNSVVGRGKANGAQRIKDYGLFIQIQMKLNQKVKEMKEAEENSKEIMNINEEEEISEDEKKVIIDILGKLSQHCDDNYRTTPGTRESIERLNTFLKKVDSLVDTNKADPSVNTNKADPSEKSTNKQGVWPWWAKIVISLLTIVGIIGIISVLYKLSLSKPDKALQVGEKFTSGLAQKFVNNSQSIAKG